MFKELRELKILSELKARVDAKSIARSEELNRYDEIFCKADDLLNKKRHEFNEKYFKTTEERRRNRKQKALACRYLGLDKYFI